MKKLIPLLIAILIFSSHDMYLKLDTYFLSPNSQAKIKLFNGTFDKSENVIDRDRMIDVSIVGNGVRERIDSTLWTEKDSMTLLNFKIGAPGTYVAGLSTFARNLAMDAQAFNDYLAHDGVTDMLEWRKSNNALDQNANEKYSKHVKTIFQVGDKRTNDWSVNLGYPIEFIPLSNPYNLEEGDTLNVRLLRSGRPLANQLITIDSESTHSHTSSDTEANHGHDHDTMDGGHHHQGSIQTRTNSHGELSVVLTHSGIWYLRTIHLVESNEGDLTHESNWATLTFEVTHSHSGTMQYALWLGGLALLGFLLFLLKKNKKLSK